MTDRTLALEAFLAANGWVGAAHRLLAADASFRRYERVTQGARCAVLMDAPPPQERVQEFMLVARLLHKLGLAAPQILAEDETQGFLLLEDFGDRTLTRALAAGDDEGALYSLAIDTLVALHQRWQPADNDSLPPYDLERLLQEAALLPDWYLPAITGQPTHDNSRKRYLEAWRQVLGRVAGARETLVLRDYHVDNLMILPGRQGVAGCGLLDFQDALIGARAYDVVSLLEDARRDIAPALARDMLARYLTAMQEGDRLRFITDYTVLGAQRAAKIIGIFTRLDRRDGKSSYLRHLPRCWHLLARSLSQPVMAPVAAWFDAEVPGSLRTTPEARPKSVSA